ncbi:MAG: FliM/FliN family flagellar motor switch protein [Sedimentisphaerales bacterium]
MSNTGNDNLTREKIQQLLAAVGVKSQEDTGQNIESVEYNWRQSHYFSQDQLGKVNDFAEKVARNFAKKFTQLYHSDFNVTIASTAQHFAGELIASDDNKSEYYLNFGDGNQIFGLIGMPAQTAILWATQLLGDSKVAEKADRDLSPLEQSLLFDIAFGIVEALSDSFDDYDLRPTSEIVKGRMPVEINAADEICKITISARKSDSGKPSEAYFLILCDKLKTIAGQKEQTSENLSAQNISKAMLNHLQNVPVPVTIQLGNGIFNFQEIMSLQVDDILVLNKRVNKPVKLILEGKTLLRGRLAKSDGKYAVVITELCNKK